MRFYINGVSFNGINVISYSFDFMIALLVLVCNWHSGSAGYYRESEIHGSVPSSDYYFSIEKLMTLLKGIIC